MALTKTQICNMALFHLGMSKEIANVDSTSETSEEARTMRVFWDVAKEEALSQYAWPFARKVAALGLVEEDPTDEWAYSYTYPSDCAVITKIQSGLRLDTRQSIIPFEVASDEDTKLIYTDLEDAVCEYTRNLSSTALFIPEFSIALSYLLASYAVPKLSKGDPMKAKAGLEQLFRMKISKAIAKCANEEVQDIPNDAEMIRGRE